MTGDVAGAIEDFRFYGEHGGKYYRFWINRLESGKDPKTILSFSELNVVVRSFKVTVQRN
ncbi:MAG: hypothetical protein DYG89_06720 [Caldilinea sp. CFX5]|nr:hypothetical protein [Caldilinea sp. CFX5]